MAVAQPYSRIPPAVKKHGLAVRVTQETFMKELFLAVIAAVIVGGTGLSAGKITAEDAVSVTYRNRDGVESVLNKEPERVIIGFGSFIDLWYASGGEAVAIPKLSEDKVPDYCRNLHQIGHFSTLNPETIIMLKPDLVLLRSGFAPHAALGKLLAQNGIRSVWCDYNNYDDFVTLLDLFCRLNNADAAERSAASGITEKVNQLIAGVKEYSHPSFAVIFVSSNGFFVEENEINTAKMLTLLGGKNIAGEGRRRVILSMEQLLLSDPDVIFLITMGEGEEIQKKLSESLTGNPAWGYLSAARNNRVHILPNELFLYLAGTRFPEAFDILAGYLYPEYKAVGK